MLARDERAGLRDVVEGKQGDTSLQIRALVTAENTSVLSYDLSVFQWRRRSRALPPILTGSVFVRAFGLRPE